MPRSALQVPLAALTTCLILSGCTALSDAFSSTSDAEVLQAVSLTESDAADGSHLEAYEGGDEVSGQVSLDLCYGDFPSEELRTGRNQVGIGDEQGDSWVSSEAILYATPQDAVQAMEELEQARGECPDEPVAAKGDGELLTWAFEPAPDQDWPAQPGIDRQSYAFTVTPTDGDAVSSSATYLQRGRMILALYSTPPEAPTDVLRNAPTPQRFTEVMGNRLAGVPAPALESGEPVEDPDGINA